MERISRITVAAAQRTPRQTHEYCGQAGTAGFTLQRMENFRHPQRGRCGNGGGFFGHSGIHGSDSTGMRHKAAVTQRKLATRRRAFSAASDEGKRAIRPSIVLRAAAVSPASICALAMLSSASGTELLSG